MTVYFVRSHLVAVVSALVFGFASGGCRNAAEESVTGKVSVLHLSEAEIEATIKSGDTLVEHTNRVIGTFMLVYKEVVTGTDGGGDLKTYFDGTNVRKIRLTVSLSSRLESTEYYFDDLEALRVIVKKARRYRWDQDKGVLVADLSDIEEIAKTVYFRDESIAAEVRAGVGTKAEADENYIDRARRLIRASRSDERRIDGQALFK